MIILAVVAFGLGLLCCIAALAPAAVLFKTIHRARPKDPGMRVLAYGCWVLATTWAAYWCVLMLETCWLLVTKDGGPGPFGLLVFPFWAVVAVVPALMALALLRVLRGRRR
jgi:hypothetical protein